MKYPLNRKRLEHLKKIATFEERFENIRNLTDSAEKISLSCELLKETQQYFDVMWKSSAPEDAMLLVGGTIGAALTAALIHPVFILALPAAYGMSFLGRDDEKALSGIQSRMENFIQDNLKNENLNKILNSPHLAAALFHCPPELKKSFDSAVNAKNLQKTISTNALAEKQEQNKKNSPDNFKI